LLAVALAAELGWALWTAARGEAVVATGPGGAEVSSVRAIGISLFTDYAFAFEVTSLLILVAMVGAVVLAKRNV
jgi:NADH-quinone oxidoreductase subunit J